MTMAPRLLSRRALFAAAAAVPSLAKAFGDASRFVPAVARHQAAAGTSAARACAASLGSSSGAPRSRSSLEARPVAARQPALFEHPSCTCPPTASCPPLRASEVENLRRYLTFGGFLFADANDG